MIGYIKGNVIGATDTTVLLENNGIGYEIICSASVYQKLLAQKSGEVYTYLGVKEDGISLYGFSSVEEKNMFLKLITVSGVGPKSGIAVLSAMDLSSLATMIATSDVKGLSKIKGLGKKTAERIILELREKVEENLFDGEAGAKKSVDSQTDQNDQDAIIALMSLGFTKTECAKVVKQAKENGSDGDKVELRLDADENYWENPSIELDKDGETITIDGQTKVTLVVTDKPSDSSSILTLDTSNVTNDLSSHYVRLRVKNVNGEHRDEKIYLNEGEGDYHFSNDQFIYSNISNGDEVELRLVSDGAYLNVLFDYNGYETDTVSVTINGQTNVEVDVVDRYVDNIVEIPYDAIQEAFGNIFYDDPGAKLTIEIKMYNVYGVGNYTETYTYTYTGEDYTDNSDIIAFAEAVNIVKTIYPNSATWSISYYEDGVNAGTVDVTGSISFSEEEDFHFVGTFDV